MALLTPNESMNSRMSLFDELYSSHDSLDNGLSENGSNQEEMLSEYSDGDAPVSLSLLLLLKFFLVEFYFMQVMYSKYFIFLVYIFSYS